MDNINFMQSPFENIHYRERSPLLGIKDVPSFPGILGDNRFLKFCFVRNPYGRLLSAYIDKIERNRPQKQEILRQLGYDDEDIERPISFSQFVHAVAEQPISAMNSHWRMQFYQTMQTEIDYDFIGRFEQLDTDLLKIGTQIRPDFYRFLIKERLNRTDSNQYFDRLYTEKLKNLVYQKYKIDFIYFGYDPI
jgi:hypothetical protein